MVLVMLCGGGIAPQQPQRDFMLRRRFRVVLLKLPESVFNVHLAAAANELQIRRRAIAGCQND